MKPLQFFLVFLFAAIHADTAHPAYLRATSELELMVGDKSTNVVYVDRAGQTWVGTQAGLLLFNENHEGSSPARHWGQPSPWSADIVDIEETSRGDFFVLTRTQGIFFKLSESLDFVALPIDVIPADPAVDLLIDKKDTVWIAFAGGLAAFKARRLSPRAAVIPTVKAAIKISSKLVLAPALGDCVGFASDAEIYCAKYSEIKQSLKRPIARIAQNRQEHAGTAIALSYRQGEFIVGTRTGLILAVRAGGRTRILLDAARVGQIRDIAYVADGHIIVGTRSALHLTPELDKPKRIETSGLIELNGVSVTKRGIWATALTGIQMLVRSSLDLWPSPNSDQPMDVTSLAALEGDRIVIGTYEGDLYLKNFGIRPVKIDFRASEARSSLRIMSLLALNDEILIGTRSNGLFRHKTSDNAHTTHFLDGKGISAFGMLSRFALIGTAAGEMYFLRTEEPTTPPEIIDNFRFETPVTSISQHRRGKIAVATTENRAVTICLTPTPDVCATHSKPKAFSSLRFISSHFDDSGDFWLGTLNNGLIHAALGRNHDIEIVSRSVQRPLDRAAVYSIQPSHDGSLWLSTDAGIWKYVINGGKASRMSRSDGLPNNDFNHSAGTTTASGMIFFGSPYGLVGFDPSEALQDRMRPTIFLRAVHLREGGRISRHSASEIDVIEAMAWKTSLRIVVSMNDFRNRLDNRYMFQIAGLQKGWIRTGSINELTIASLPPGEYTVLARGVDPSRLETSNTIHLPIHVRPPWWRTQWAWALYLTLIAIAVYLINVAWVRISVAKRERAHELKVQEDTEQALDAQLEQIEGHNESLALAWQDSAKQLSLTQEIADHCAGSVSVTSSAEPASWLQLRIEALGVLNDCNAIHLGSLSTDLHAFVNEITLELHDQLEADEDMAIVLNNVSQTPVPRGHALFIGAVLHELLRNAFQHAFVGRPSDSRLISVYVEFQPADAKPGSTYSIKVEDNGIGALWEPSDAVLAGGGLGLVQRLSRRLDGDVSLTDTGGSVFEVVLRFDDQAP